MKTLMDKHAIIKLKLEGYSNRTIAKMLGMNRKTVNRYWNEYKFQTSELETGNGNVKEIQEAIVSSPKYDVSNRRPSKYTQELDARLDEILLDEERKNSIFKNHKQKLTKFQIYEQLKMEGFEISYTTITRRINAKLRTGTECFIKQEYEFGERLEYDFGEVKLLIDGEPNTYHIAVLSSPAANFRWAYLYKNQKKDVFLDSHVRFFEMLGGIHQEIVYDNMRNVVVKFIGRHEKELSEDLIKMSIYYGFKINVTNCFSGNEKGHVEGSVKIIRNKVFAQKYEFRSFEDAENYLESSLIVLNEQSQIEQEKEFLLPARPKLELATLTLNKVNKYSFVQVENNFYSVPEYLVGKEVSIKNYVNQIIVYANNLLVCKHKKKDGFNEISIDITHYLKSFIRKPGAIKNSTALRSIPKLKVIFDQYFNTNPKKFIEIITLHQDKTMDDILSELENYTKLSVGHTPIDHVGNVHELSQTTRSQTMKYDYLTIRKDGTYAN